MMDTRGVRGVLFIPAVATLLAVLSLCGLCAAQAAVTWPAAVAHAAQFSPEARIVVLDIASGRLLASSHLAEAGRTLAAPGSTLKPLVLYSLIASGRWDPSRRIACTRKLSLSVRLPSPRPVVPLSPVRVAILDNRLPMSVSLLDCVSRGYGKSNAVA